jgi:hypothetical protein
MTAQRTAIYVRYRDHVLFKDVDPSAFGPFERETIGWLDCEASDFVRLVWERSVENGENPAIKQKATGLVILKGDILEMSRVGVTNFKRELSGRPRRRSTNDS